MRVGAVDMGTNSTRLLVADVEDEDLREVRRELRITRLGEGVDRDRRLADAAVARTRGVLREYAASARELGAERVLATATSAVRDAANGRAFLAAIHDELGFETRLLTGREEGTATFRGVMSDRRPAPGRVVVIDVGGGSTEVSLGSGGTLERTVSIDAGCVRGTERWLSEDAIAPAAIAIADDALAALFATELDDAFSRAGHGIAVAGTATTLAALDLGLASEDAALIHGHLLTREAIGVWRDRLAPLTSAERCAYTAIEPGRAPVIVAGATVLGAALDRLGLAVVEVSVRDILHGIALLAADQADRAASYPARGPGWRNW